MLWGIIISTTLLVSHACKTDLDCSLNGVCDVQTGKSVFFFGHPTRFFVLNFVPTQKRVLAILGFPATNCAEQ